MAERVGDGASKGWAGRCCMDSSSGVLDWRGVGRSSQLGSLDTPLPFKLNQHHCHRILEQRHWVMNWREYDASLHQRGSLTVWFTAKAIGAGPAQCRSTVRPPRRAPRPGRQNASR